ncbi:MAG: hypothetical protein J0L62_02995 [Bacteroidetes bacterium]|nr:hypothetical protein [Bacteroidota bacterium]
MKKFWIVMLASVFAFLLIGCDKDEDKDETVKPAKVLIGKHETTLGEYPENQYANEVANIVSFADDIGSSYTGYLQIFDKLTWNQDAGTHYSQFKPQDLFPGYEGDLVVKIYVTESGQNQIFKMTQTGNAEGIILNNALTFEATFSKDAKSGKFTGFLFTNPSASYIWGTEEWSTTQSGVKTGAAKYWENASDSAPDIVEYELNSNKTGTVTYKPNGVKRFFAKWFLDGSGEITYFNTSGTPTGTNTWVKP